jgi:hypothetical protein
LDWARQVVAKMGEAVAAVVDVAVAGAGGLRTSGGEVVRRIDLDRAAGMSGELPYEDPNLAGPEELTSRRRLLLGTKGHWTGSTS